MLVATSTATPSPVHEASPTSFRAAVVSASGAVDRAIGLTAKLSEEDPSTMRFLVSAIGEVKQAVSVLNAAEQLSAPQPALDAAMGARALLQVVVTPVRKQPVGTDPRANLREASTLLDRAVIELDSAELRQPAFD